MRPQGSPEQLERRRRQAVALRKHGFGPTEIARRLGTTPQTVCLWVRQAKAGGPDALKARLHPGRPCKLNTRQRRALAARLLKGAVASGFATDLWTCPRIARLIADRYGVTYHVSAIPHLMAGLGFSPAETRAPGT
jgi:transposase